MSRYEVDQDSILDEDLEKSFDEALEELQKAADDGDYEEDDQDDDVPRKRRRKRARITEDEDEPEDEEYEEEDMEKSVEESLLEDQEASAAMDISPFLHELVKAIDASISGINEKFSARLRNVEKMAVAHSKLSKSMNDRIVELGGYPIPPKSRTTLRKSSRFGDEDSTMDMGDVLIKSHDWLKDKKIDLAEAGRIEIRVNKGLLGQVGDPLDSKIARLIKENA